MNGTTPRLGALQWVGPMFAGLVPLAVAFTLAPLFTEPGKNDSYFFSPLLPGYHGLVSVMLFPPLLIALLTALIGAFRILAAAPHRQEFGALQDLGSPRRSLVRHQTQLGLTHSIVAALTGASIGAIATQAVKGFGGDFNSGTAWTLLIIVGSSIAATVLAYALVARWTTGTPGTTSRRSLTTNNPGRSRLSRWWPWVAAGIVIAAPLIMRAWAASGYEYSGGSQRPMSAKLLIGTAVTLQVLSMIAVTALLILAGARAATALTTLAGRTLSRATDGTGLGAIAADGLTRPTPVRGVAMVGIGVILAIATALSMGANGVDARNHLSADLIPHAVVSTFHMAPPRLGPVVSATTTAGAPKGLPDALLAAFLEDPRLIVVPTAAILTDPVKAEGASRDPGLLLAPDALAFDKVSNGAARNLFFSDGYSWGYVSSIVVAGRTLTMHSPSVSAPVTGVPRAWAESQLGALPTSAVLLYPAGETPVVDILADYDLAEFQVTRPTLSRSTPDNSVQASTLFGIAGPFLLLAIGLVIALAFTVQRLRAGDYATMSALGATRSALRGATAIEAAVTTLIGAALGMAFGVALGAYATTFTAGVGLTQLSSIVWWNIGFDIMHAPWLTLWALTLATTGLAAVGSLVARARTDASTPSEQLREAIKEGAL